MYLLSVLMKVLMYGSTTRYLMIKCIFLGKICKETNM